MRPQILFPLFRDVTDLSGIGPRLAKLVAKAAGPLVVDLLWHVPNGLVDRRNRPTIAEARTGELATLEVVVDAHEPPARSRLPYRVRVRDETGFLTLTFFHPRKDYLKSVLPVGETRYISGKIEDYSGTPQITHPDLILTAEDFAQTPLVAPTYPLTAGLTAKVMAKAVKAALDRVKELPEWQDPAWIAKAGWPAWSAALHKCHAPETGNDLSPQSPARRRLAYDELLANQLALALTREKMKARKGRSLPGNGRLAKALTKALPFSLTGSQQNAIQDICKDMENPARMMRLLQGDVGSGKTVVALFAMLHAVEAGAQAALMAPTEILARQHFSGIQSLAEQAGVKTALLTGREKARERQPVLEGLADGSIPIVVGTHALFQEEVAFQDLALAVVDEQHRFGVHQRMMLGQKGPAADVLVMTATPIPRTLTLTAYGDMAVSKLTEKPAGRKPIATRAVSASRLEEVIQHLAHSIQEGRQAYWVCPLVEDSEAVNLTSAEDRYGVLMQHFASLGKTTVGLVHGRMKGAEKDAVMAAFKAGEVKVLVATTVIEVGVDVPNASIIVIEHAERFGLAQLHQLRGRVGRGATASSCLLLYASDAGETARARLKVMRETQDGFVIAEEDLRLRGAGDVLGTRQSGLPVFRLASLEDHSDLLEVARDDADLIITKDPDLSSPRGQALRVLLYLFQRDEAVRYLRSG